MNRRGTLTRAAERSSDTRRWQILVLCIMALIVALLLVSAVVQYKATLTNRGFGRGSRVVQCTTLAQVAPDLKLKECPSR